MNFKYRNPKGVTPGTRVSTGNRARPPATSNGTVLEEVYSPSLVAGYTGGPLDFCSGTPVVSDVKGRPSEENPFFRAALYRCCRILRMGVGALVVVTIPH